MRTVAQKQNQLHERLADGQTRSKVTASEPIRNTPVMQRFPQQIGNRALGQLLSRIAKKPANENRAGLPGKLKAGIEKLSGMTMDDVNVRYNSRRPAAVQALAHTRGSDIHLGPGQEKHLAHEAWHVVQQKQGRVKGEGVQVKGASINEDPALEREADRMGANASKAGSFPVHANPLSPVSQAPQAAVVQRKKVPDPVRPTDPGQFETTTFQPLNDSGVDIVLMFHPNDQVVDATKIAMVQSVKATNEAGKPYAVDPTRANRMVTGRSGKGYVIDAPGETNNPLYFDTKNLAPAEDLKDTPSSANTTGTASLGANTNYEFGFSYLASPTAASKQTHSAGISDRPQGIKRKGAGMMFETTALAIEGADKNKYYGSVKWGYKIGGTKAAPKVAASDMFDITLASSGTPTANFGEAAKLWNVGQTRGTLEVNPTSKGTKRSAFVQYVSGTGPRRQPKGTKLQFIGEVKGSTDPMIKAEILDAQGNPTGTVVLIYVADVKDTGGGSPNKPLP